MKDVNTGSVVIFIRGLPGSGKSFLADALQTRLAETHGAEAVLLLDPDGIDRSSQAYLDHCKKLTEAGVEEKFFPYRFLRGKAERAVSAGMIIIWSQPFTLRGGFDRTVAYLQDYAAEHKLGLEFLLVEVELEPSVAKARVEERKIVGGHGPSDDSFETFVNDYVSFADSGLPTLTLDGADDVNTSVDAVLASLN